MAMESWLCLALAPEVGPVLAHRLLAAFGTPEAALAASERALLGVSGLGPSRARRLLDPAIRRAAQDEARRIAEAGARLVTFADDEYPPLLKRLEYPPLVLWVRGRIDPLDRLALALVGPRSPSAYGRLMAGALAPALAAHGLTLVSGLAHGIDADAHRAALDAQGRTLAVVGQGLGTPIYPSVNAELALRIVEEDRGALISIFPMATEPGPGLFPLRNEIIAGLSLGTLVIEASTTSGTLITARHAAAAGRVVMACPGDANRRLAQGSNRLLAEGAFLVQNVEDVLAALAQELRRERAELGTDAGEAATVPEEESERSGQDGRDHPGGAAPLPGYADDLVRLILQMLEEEPCPADLLLDRCLESGHAGPAVLDRLLRLEMDGLIRQLPGRLYALARALG